MSERHGAAHTLGSAIVKGELEACSWTVGASRLFGLAAASGPPIDERRILEDPESANG